jgi:hypothetical protein
MDLAVRTFERVEGVFKFLVPGLETTEMIIDDALRRWGVVVHPYLGQNAINAKHDGAFCRAVPELPKLSSWAIWAAAIRDHGIPIILTGMKRADSQSRRRLMAWSSAREDIIHPIAGWEKRSVLSYLRLKGIPIPEGTGRATSGIELVPSELLFLYDHYPNDFERIEEYFPFIRAVVERRKFYGS